MTHPEITQDDESLWSDSISAMVDSAFQTVSRNPSDHEVAIAYRRAIATQRVKHEAEIARLKADKHCLTMKALFAKTDASAAEALLAEAREVIAPFAAFCDVEDLRVTIAVQSNLDTTLPVLNAVDFRRAAAFLERSAK